ncbi:unnamed protein product [Echinostoma caproni]|uniref:Uncharacterized protein n=1 Tax=Echinostoma caproni TaxID=27848 RepID=A0A183BCI7_9TREM|nr:unnamed protein product [Echinostoma caproni]
MLGAIRSLSGPLPLTAFKLLYVSHARPRLEYGDLAVFPCTVSEGCPTGKSSKGCYTPRRRTTWDQLRGTTDCNGTVPHVIQTTERRPDLHQTHHPGRLWPRVAVRIPHEEQQPHQKASNDVSQDAVERFAADQSSVEEALNIGDREESYPDPATADYLGQRNAWQLKHRENTELGVQEPGYILARATSPVT